jgi:hypothetical protein
MQLRFKKLAERLGYKIVPLTTRINNILTRRPDVMRVEKHGDFIMVIPKRMYGFPIASYRDLLGLQQPDYFTCEKVLLKKHYV